MLRKGLFFFSSWLESTTHLTPRETDRLIVAIVRYGTLGTAPEGLTRKLQAVFEAYRHFIDAQDAKAAASAAQREGASRTHKTPSRTHKTPPRTHEVTPPSTSDTKPPRDSVSQSDGYASTTRKNTTILSEISSIPNENEAKPNENASKLNKNEAFFIENGSRELEKALDNHALSQNSTYQQTLDPQKTTIVPDNHALSPSALATRARNQEQEQEQEQDAFLLPAATDEEKKKGLALLREGDAAAASSLGAATVGEEGIPLWEEVEAYWAQEGLTSVAREFFDYYAARNWYGRERTRLRNWQVAARNWERKFLRDIAPIRLKDAKRTTAQQQEVARVAEIARLRAQARIEREQRYAQQQARACSYAEARAAYERALQLTGGDAAAAMEMLKRSPLPMDTQPPPNLPP